MNPIPFLRQYAPADGKFTSKSKTPEIKSYIYNFLSANMAHIFFLETVVV